MTQQSKFVAIKNGRGVITGYIEMFYNKRMNKWFTIPGLSRFRNA